MIRETVNPVSSLTMVLQMPSIPTTTCSRTVVSKAVSHCYLHHAKDAPHSGDHSEQARPLHRAGE